MKSDNVKKGIQQATHRSLFNALGMTKEEMERPLVGIVRCGASGSRRPAPLLPCGHR